MKWELDIDLLQIVFPRAPYFDKFVPKPRRVGGFNLLFTRQIAHGEALLGAFFYFADRALIYHLTTKPSRGRTDVNNVVRSPNNLLVMLYDDDRISLRLQLPEHSDQLIRIMRMETDARFVEYIKRAHEATSQRGG